MVVATESRVFVGRDTVTVFPLWCRRTGEGPSSGGVHEYTGRSRTGWGR